jgi:hypothetical protein
MYLQVHVVVSPREVAVCLHLNQQVTFPVMWHVHCKFKEMTDWLQPNDSIYVATDAVWLLFTGLVQMFCTSKFNILVL